MMHDDLPAVVERFYKRHRKELYSFALAVTRDPEAAEDAVQTAIVGVLSRRRLPRTLMPYIMRAVRNAAIDWRRACARHGGSPVEVESRSRLSKDTRRWLEQCLSQLPDDVREVIVLKEVIGMTFREIGIICRRPLPTVASRYRRGIERLRVLMVKESP
jgi:RNA polymerase sigma-70 factor (ECF subfamily)